MGGKEADRVWSRNDADSLQHLIAITRLFHHRNRNQHRRSVWWRHFSVFRKHLTRISDHVTRLTETPSSNLAKVKKKAEDEQALAQIREARVLWMDILVPKWSGAFSQVTADNRFAVLGLVLQAILAEASRILRLTDELKRHEQVDAEKMLGSFAKDPHVVGKLGPITKARNNEDMGEVVSRNEALVATSSESERQSSSTAKIQSSHGAADVIGEVKSRTGSTEKRHRTGNVIDDLFSGLK